MIRFVSSALLPVAFSALLPMAAAGAQNVGALDPRFQPWVGCWRTVSSDGAASIMESRPTRACVTPSTTTAGSVDVTMYRGDSLLSRAAIPLPGNVSARQIDDCTGTETAAWSADESRLVLRAALDCGRGITRTETGLMAISPIGDWVQIQQLEVGRNAAATVTRFRFDEARTAALVEAQPSLKGKTTNATLRYAMGGTTSLDQILDLSKRAPLALVEAYVAEMGQSFTLDGKTLVQLADRGMPTRVIDLMIAMANPQTFTVGATAPQGDRAMAGANVDAARIGEVPQQVNVSNCSILNDMCYGPGGMGAWGLGWQYGFGLDPWGFPLSRYGFNRFGYNPYGYGWGNGLYYGNNPIVIVNRPSPGGDVGTPSSGRGRAVNGGGYTRRPETTGGTMPRSTGSGASSVGGGSSSGGGATSTGGSTGRTAKPRGSGGGQ